MKLLVRFLHWIVCAFVPAVLAACYGAPYDPAPVKNDTTSGKITSTGTDTTTSGTEYGGTVKDAATGTGILGIRITCKNAVNDKIVYSEQGGAFAFDAPAPCTELLAEDIDGAHNGGEFASGSADLAGAHTDLEIMLEKK